MFINVGGKIKGISVVICWLGIIASIIIGSMTFNNGITINETYHNGAGAAFMIQGIVIINAGSLISWIGSLLVYGFGDMIENTSNIWKELRYIESDLSKTNSRSY